MDHTTMLPALYYPAVAAVAAFDSDRPRPQFLLDGEKMKVLVVGLEPGQDIPVHPESLAVYHFLAGEGTMTVNGDTFAVAPGATIITPAGAARGIHANSRLTFLAAKTGD